MSNTWSFDGSWCLNNPCGPFLYLENKEDTLENVFDKYELKIINLSKDLKKIPLAINQRTDNEIIYEYPLTLLDVSFYNLEEYFSLGVKITCKYKIQNNKYVLDSIKFETYVKHTSHNDCIHTKVVNSMVKQKKHIYKHYLPCDYYGVNVEGVVHLSKNDRLKYLKKYDEYVENKRLRHENTSNDNIVSVCKIPFDSKLFYNYMLKRFQEKTGKDVETYYNSKLKLLKKYIKQ